MHYITLPNSPPKIFLFFDSIHLLKDICNSLLNKKKFVFPAFTFEISNISVSSKEGYVAWSDLRGSLNKFPDIFCMGTFIDSTHMKL